MHDAPSDLAPDGVPGWAEDQPVLIPQLLAGGVEDMIKKMGWIVAVAALAILGSSPAFAQIQIRDARAKAFGDIDGRHYNNNRTPVRVYRAPAAAAPMTAAAPAERRSFSAEPAAPAANPAPAPAPAATAQNQPRVVRTFSTEPSAPVVRRRPARVPTYLLPKSDPRRFDSW